MAGVREQGGGVADIAVHGFGHDQRGVERNADRERLAKAGGRMDMRVPKTMSMVVTMVVRMVAMIMVVISVMVVAGHL
ncbi:hypothetical protein [Bradyrhizobium sp. BR 1432]|uniref:hypothetical protein n=1 Tax=Bradyrhizobium sp. BR 1432 TaxID=3447966 RepID=UPI003EE50989